MRFATSIVVALGLVMGAVLLAVAPGLGQVKTPPDFPMEKAESSLGQVTFSHEKHRAKVDKCTTCHMKDFKMKRGASGQITLAAKQEGKFCGACHDGKTQVGGAVVFPIDECDRCHVP
jgi:c(7)-type cytochrome triheme protein